jgi:tRNA (adenine37-N6)-methyltransferase
MPAKKTTTKATPTKPELKLEIQAIGQIHSPFKDKFGTPRQSQIAKSTLTRIVLNKKVAPEETLLGLEVGTYLWVIFWFHLNTQKKQITKVRPPRLRGETLGVLATRSPHRPNPLGLSLGKIVKIEKTEIYLEGLDLVDGTPVMDIKPFLPIFDQPKDIPTSWIENHPFPILDVSFADGLFENLNAAQTKLLKKQLSEILTEDPRPLAYLKKPLHTYWLKYDDYDIGFEIKESTLFVKEIK